jgi:biopolymer transport protein ExbB/TolQ
MTIYEMMLRGWPVLSVLLVMSILSISALVDRLLLYRNAARMPARLFITHLVKLIDGQGVVAAIQHCERHTQPIAAVAAEILGIAGGREARLRAQQHATQVQLKLLQIRVSILGTVASTAPFVGLLGTVIGIIKAFADIAANVGGGPEVVAAGIAEALITTACGLLVAIPALIGYNFCVNRVQLIADELDDALFYLLEKLDETSGDQA